MINNERISRLAQQLGERLQDASHAPEEIQRNVHNVMRGAFDRMELVTREDFDILMDVLQRTRSRVESLEKQVAALEASLDDGAGSSGSPAMVAADTAAPPEDAASSSNTASSSKKSPGNMASAKDTAPPEDTDASSSKPT